jgi:hypothetical protein
MYCLPRREHGHLDSRMTVATITLRKPFTGRDGSESLDWERISDRSSVAHRLVREGIGAVDP